MSPFPEDETPVAGRASGEDTAAVPGDVVALSRWRAAIARARSPRRRLDAILADPAAPALVPRLPVEDFYYLVRDVGLADARELLRLATPEQLRACLDFDLWERDRVVPGRVIPWLQVLADIGPARVASAMRGLDAELVALLLARHARIHERARDEEPDPETAHPVIETPDGEFLVEVVTPDAEGARTIECLVDLLYRADPAAAGALLAEAKCAVASELEELSYRWRTARMADLGFVEYYDALEVYRYLDPRSVRPDEGTARPVAAVVEPDLATVPAPFAQPLGEDCFLSRTLGAIADPDVVRPLEAALVALCNRILSADQIDPTDLDAVRLAVARARDTLSLGLEHLAAGDPLRAVGVLGAVSLVRVFRSGFSLTVELQRRAKVWAQEETAAPELLATLEPLLRSRPEFPAALDEPPMAGARPFRTVADVERVAAYLARGEGD